jgi:hypothetical protein
MIPPRVSSLKEIGKLQSRYAQAHPTLFNRMKVFYKNIPKGNAIVNKPTTWTGIAF